MSVLSFFCSYWRDNILKTIEFPIDRLDFFITRTIFHTIKTARTQIQKRKIIIFSETNRKEQSKGKEGSPWIFL